MKKFIKVFVFSAFVSTSALPFMAVAEVPTSTGKGGGEAALCSNLAGRASEWVNRFSSRLNELKDKEAARETKWRDGWDKHMTDLVGKRAERDAEVDAHAAKLNEKAATDAQKQAVISFRAAVKTAIEARQKAVNAALDAFHKGIEGALAARKSATEKALSDFVAAFKAAADKAKADCASGVAARAVRATFTSAVKTARENLNVARKAGNNFSDAMKKLVAAKKTAFDKAQGDFKSALEKAKADLKAILGSEKPTSTTP